MLVCKWKKNLVHHMGCRMWQLTKRNVNKILHSYPIQLRRIKCFTALENLYETWKNAVVTDCTMLLIPKEQCGWVRTRRKIGKASEWRKTDTHMLGRCWKKAEIPLVKTTTSITTSEKRTHTLPNILRHTKVSLSLSLILSHITKDGSTWGTVEALSWCK